MIRPTRNSAKQLQPPRVSAPNYLGRDARQGLRRTVIVPTWAVFVQLGVQAFERPVGTAGFDSLWKLLCQAVWSCFLGCRLLADVGHACWPAGRGRRAGGGSAGQVVGLTALARGRDDRGRGRSPRVSGLVRAG